MKELASALARPTFRWRPKHLNHIAERIAIDKRNVSFLAINALFRQNDYQVSTSTAGFEDSFVITGLVPLQRNDKLRTISERLYVVFRLDKYGNIIVITAFSESDQK